MQRLIRFWVHRVNPQLATLIAAVGTIGLLSCLVILLGLSWLFQEVLEKEAFGFDTTVLLAVHRWSNPILDQVMLSLTRLGDPEFVVVIIVLSLGLLLWRRQRTEAKMLTIACLGALILNQGLKLFFAKPRPQLWTPLIVETSFSFPSGHALGSLVLYGFLAYLLAINYPRQSHLDLRFCRLFSDGDRGQSLIFRRSLGHGCSGGLCRWLSVADGLHHHAETANKKMIRYIWSSIFEES